MSHRGVVSAMRSAVLMIDSWAGRSEIPVTVFGETPKRYRCILACDAKMPGRNNYKKHGEVVLAPKQAIKFV